MMRKCEKKECEKQEKQNKTKNAENAPLSVMNFSLATAAYVSSLPPPMTRTTVRR